MDNQLIPRHIFYHEYSEKQQQMGRIGLIGGGYDYDSSNELASLWEIIRQRNEYGDYPLGFRLSQIELVQCTCCVLYGERKPRNPGSGFTWKIDHGVGGGEGEWRRENGPLYTAKCMHLYSPRCRLEQLNEVTSCLARSNSIMCFTVFVCCVVSLCLGREGHVSTVCGRQEINSTKN